MKSYTIIVNNKYTLDAWTFTTLEVAESVFRLWLSIPNTRIILKSNGEILKDVTTVEF